MPADQEKDLTQQIISKGECMKPRSRKFVSFLIMLALLVSAAATRVFASPDQPAVPNAPRHGEIVGGQPADPHEYPWQVWMLTSSSWCGGSLIDPSWVVTAGHCAKDVAASSIRVGLGLHDRYQSPNTEQWLSVDRVIVHPGFGWDYDDDIALLHLVTPAQLNEFVQVIPLVSQDEAISDGTPTTITGWGETGAGVSDILMEAVVPVTNQQICASSYAGHGYTVTDNMICAGYPEGEIDACQGDSGGPLVIPDGAGGWRLAGITSWGIGCALPNLYGVYTRVAQYVDWINEQMSGTGTPPTATPAFPPTLSPPFTPSPTPSATPSPTPEPLPAILAGFYPSDFVLERSTVFTSTLTVFNTTDVTQTEKLRLEADPVLFAGEGWEAENIDGKRVYTKNFVVPPQRYVDEVIVFLSPAKAGEYTVYVKWFQDAEHSALYVLINGSDIYLPLVGK